MSAFQIDVTGRRGCHEKLSQNDDAFPCPTGTSAQVSVKGSTPEHTKVGFSVGQYIAPAAAAADSTGSDDTEEDTTDDE